MIKKTFTYPIKRWDAMLFKNSITKMPVVYLEPDDNFMKYISKKDGEFCVIRGTGMAYDKNPTTGFIRPSSVVPSNRQNFYDETGYYTITLTLPWLGYPDGDKLGIIMFDIVENLNDVLLPEKPSKIEEIGSSPEPKFQNKIKLLLISVVLIVIVIVCLMLI